MAVISEKDIQHISQKLGEPSGFFEFRKEVFESGGKDTYFEYGLGISHDAGDFARSDYKKSPEYKIEEGELLAWKDMWENKGCSEEIFALLKEHKETLSNHALSGQGMLFSDGRVFVGKRDSVSEIVFDTDLNGSRDLVVVVAHSGARVRVSDTMYSTNKNGGRTLVILAKQGSHVSYMQTHAGNKSLYSQVIAVAKKDAKIDIISTSLAEKHAVKVDVVAILDGEYSEVEVHNAALSSKKGLIDMQSTTHHKAASSHSKLYASGVAGGSSKMIYRSDIVMQKDTCRDVEGEQKGSFIIASKGAEIDAIPSLDIAQKDIACSHSVSVGHLTDKDLYYPKLRGLDDKEASKMIIEGMLQSEIAHNQNKEEVQKVQRMLHEAVGRVV